jgi:hypothetical protein
MWGRDGFGSRFGRRRERRGRDRKLEREFKVVVGERGGRVRVGYLAVRCGG